jgi:retinoid hydroxylase
MNKIQQKPLPPGNFGLPLIGETLDFLRDPNFQAKRLQKYGKIFKTHIFNRPTVVMIGAEANQCLFKNENKYVRATWPQSTRILLGNSLATQQGNFHLSRRKVLYDAFQPRALESYIPTMEMMTRAYIKRWEQQQELTWYPELRNYTFDVASKLFVGTDQASQTPSGEWFEEWVRGLFTLPINLPWTAFGKAYHCRQKLLTAIEKIIIERQKNPLLIAEGKDALSLLLQAKDEDGNSLSLSELKDQILLLLFAGHETLTSSLVSFCLLMAQYPDVLAKIRQEQRDLNLSFPLTLEQLKKMTYLEQVLKEVLRFISPVGGGFREVIEPFEYEGYHIPQGWIIQYQIWQTHQDQSLYTNAEKFDPDRFAPDRLEDKQSSFGYIPFGGGLRECLGKEFARLEMRILATLLAHQYQWELLPNQDLSIRAIPSPAPRDGLKVHFGRFNP